MNQSNLAKLPRTFINLDCLVLANFYESDGQTIAYLLFNNDKEFHSERVVFSTSEKQSLSEAIDSFDRAFSADDKKSEGVERLWQPKANELVSV